VSGRRGPLQSPFSEANNVGSGGGEGSESHALFLRLGFEDSSLDLDRIASLSPLSKCCNEHKNLPWRWLGVRTPTLASLNPKSAHDTIVGTKGWGSARVEAGRV
jgi:hypothetical protein